MDPNSPIIPNLWTWNRLGAGLVTSRLTGESKVIVAVVDSGVHAHKDLAPCLEVPRTVLGTDTRDDDNHGTLLAGTIAAFTKDCKDGEALQVRILPVKFYSQQILPTADLGAAAIKLAVEAGAKVIVLSWDCGYDTPALKAAIECAGRKNVSVVVAAGNQSLDNDLYRNWPANHGAMSHVITVMATEVPPDTLGRMPDIQVEDDIEDKRATFSSYGKQSVHIAAPGVAIPSMVPYCVDLPAGSTYTPGYQYYSGTSPATAHVAGLVALIRSQNPNWTADQVKQHLIESAEPLRSLDPYCVSKGIAHYERAIVGPISNVVLQVGPVKKNTLVNVTWKNIYMSSYCGAVDIALVDDLGNLAENLGRKFTNTASRASADGTAIVSMPDRKANNLKLRVSSAAGNLYGESLPFNLV